MGFQLSDTVDKNKVFLVKQSKIEERFDPNFYRPYSQELNFLFKVKQIRSISTLLIHPPEYKRIYTDSGTQLIRSQNVRPDGIDLNNSPVYLDPVVLSKDDIVPQIGDILIVRSGINAGDTATVKHEISNAIIGADTLLLRVIESVNPEFIQIFFSIPIGIELMQRYLTGATNKHISPHYLAKIKIPVPPIALQNQMVAQMNAAYDAKKSKEAEAQRLLDSIDDYLLQELAIELPEEGENSIQDRMFFRKFSEVSGGRFDPYCHKPFFHEIVTNIEKSKYQVTTMGRITSNIINGYDSRQYTNIGAMYLRVANINKNEFDLSNVKYIPTTDITKDISLEVGDLLLTRKGSFGNAVIVNAETEDAVISSEIFKISFSKSIQIETRYLSEWLNSKVIQFFFDKIKTGAIMGHLSQDSLVKTPVVLPEIKKQQEIADHIEHIRNKAKDLRKQAAADLEQAKNEVEAMILGGDKK